MKTITNLSTQELLKMKQEALARKLIIDAQDSVIAKIIQGAYNVQ